MVYNPSVAVCYRSQGDRQKNFFIPTRRLPIVASADGVSADVVSADVVSADSSRAQPRELPPGTPVKSLHIRRHGTRREKTRRAKRLFPAHHAPFCTFGPMPFTACRQSNACAAFFALGHPLNEN